MLHSLTSSFFFFNDTATTEIYTLSLHDALPISSLELPTSGDPPTSASQSAGIIGEPPQDRKSTRLNSSHLVISYAVFCLKKKKQQATDLPIRSFTSQAVRQTLT